MSSNTGTSIFDEALACIGQRIASILIQPADKDTNYIASLHNEVLAAAWIIGLLASNGSSPPVPEPIRVAFHSFSDIKNPGTYAAPDDRLLPQAGYNKSVNPKFNLTEWWKFAEGKKLSEPFDVGEELVAALLRALEMRLDSAEIRARTIKSFKEVSQRQKDIESRMESLKLILQHNYLLCEETANRLDNQGSSHEK